MNAHDIPSECLDDPQFVKVLTASLCAEIAASQVIANETDAEIQALKESVAKGLEKRKLLKQMKQDLTKKKNIQEATLESLERDVRHRSVEVGAMKDRLDDSTLREIGDRKKFQKILDDYKELWEGYKTDYEKYPLAVVRKQCRIDLKKLQIELMLMEYKRDEYVKMMKTRKEIDAIRIRVSGVDVAAMVLKRWEDQKYLENLKTAEGELRKKLTACTYELTQLQREEEKKKLAESETLKMPPPRIDFSFMRSIYTEQIHKSRDDRVNKNRPKNKRDMSPSRESDTTSINTLMLEEMCQNNGDEEILNSAANSIRPTNEDADADSLNIPASVSMILESLDARHANQKKNVEIAKSANNLTHCQPDIQEQLKKLHIKKTTTFADEKEINRINIVENPMKNKVLIDESHQRTQRWCVESQEFAKYPVSLIMDTSEQVCEKQVLEKAASFHESEIDEAAAMRNSSNERNDQRKIQNCQKNDVTDDEPKVKKSKLEEDIATEVSAESNDDSQMPVIPSGGKPKIKNIEVIDYPIKLPVAVGEREQSMAMATSERQFLPSCVSSENLSNVFDAAMQDPSGAIAGKGIEDFPSMSNWQNWSPPQSASEVSFASSFNRDKQNVSPPREKETEKPKNEIPPMEFAGFFKKKASQNIRNMF